MNQEEIYPKKLKKHTQDYKKAKQTLKQSFPLKERSPIWALAFLSKHPGVDFLTWYTTQNQYIGVSYSVHHENRMLLLYLAIDQTARSKGYGTKIIKYLEQKDNIKETVVDIESPYQQSENLPQRQRRFEFYKRLGFHSSNMEIQEPGCNYLILGTAPENNNIVTTYEELTKQLAGNLVKLNIKQV